MKTQVIIQKFFNIEIYYIYKFIISSQNKTIEQCKICGEDYIYGECLERQWCKSCQINDLKKKFACWTSGNKEIDGFIQEMQLNIDFYSDIIFEWIPPDQLNDITEKI